MGGKIETPSSSSPEAAPQAPDLASLQPGDRHYRAYVGPALEYDLVGASQFNLLTTLGLRSAHRCLDVGCGSLRAGRLLIPYLDPCRYFGIEPNAWLLQDGVGHEVGHDLVRIKQPSFDHNSTLDCGVFGVKFDFILAQSIFSHTGQDMLRPALASASAALAGDGLLVATFVRPERKPNAARGENASGWIYPKVVTYPVERWIELCAGAGLHARLLPWRHPRQQWFAAALDPAVLPPPDFDQHLTGVTR